MFLAAQHQNFSNYESLDASLLQRYAPGVNQLFADIKKDSESRRLLRRQVAEDMYYLNFACKKRDTQTFM